MEDDKKIYYGIHSTPKGARRASMQEAVEKNRVGYYGVKKIDSRTLQFLKLKEKESKIVDNLKAKLVGIKSEIKKINNIELKRNFSTTKQTNEHKKKWTEKRNELQDKFDRLLKEYQRLKEGKIKGIEVKEKQKVKTAGKKIECSICDKTFSHASSKSRHMKKFHAK